jgi:hypothetical protein
MARQSNEIRFSIPAFSLKSLTIKILRDGKLLIKFGENQNLHYTLQPGVNSGRVDLHKTNEELPRTDPTRHETLVEIQRGSIEAALRELDPSFVNEMLALWHPCASPKLHPCQIIRANHRRVLGRSLRIRTE